MCKQKYEFDVIVIGLGPAGMAVSAMGAEMGLKVCAIEKNKVGGECMNVGCIPSKSLLKMAELRSRTESFYKLNNKKTKLPELSINPFSKIKEYIDYIGEKKTLKMFEKVTMINEAAEFVDTHTVKAGDKTYTAQNIYIATGTKPMKLPIDGIDKVEYLTNESLFYLDKVPASMTIIGGGAIGSEMAQAFARLGAKISIVQLDEYLVPIGDREAGELLQKRFDAEGIAYYNGRKINKVYKDGDLIALETDKGEVIKSEKLLMGAGRKIDLSPLKPENAGIKLGRRGEAVVNDYLQTSTKNIYAVGDCNGYMLLSHAAMHQGMIALMNSMMPRLLRRKFKGYAIPWTVFTEPQISYVGLSEKKLKAKGIKYKTIRTNYADYGAAIAEDIAEGFIKVHISPLGKIYGVSIVGEGSGEMINEWALAIQNNLRLHQIMMQAHSFPTMGFMSKRIGEIWMMSIFANPTIKKICQFMFRI